MGAILAVVLYFAKDIWTIARAWVLGLVKAEYRGTFDHRMGWYVIVGTIPIGDRRPAREGPDHRSDLRSLWVVAVALILWSGVMLYAEQRRQARSAARSELTHEGRDHRRRGAVHRADARASPAPAPRSRPACSGASTG